MTTNRKWRVVYSTFHPVTGELLNSGVDFVPAENAVEAAKAIARDGDAEKSITARVVTLVTPDLPYGDSEL